MAKVLSEQTANAVKGLIQARHDGGIEGAGFMPGVFLPYSVPPSGTWDLIVADGAYDPDAEHGDDTFGYWKGQRWNTNTSGYETVLLVNPNTFSLYTQSRQFLNGDDTSAIFPHGVTYLAMKRGTKTLGGTTYDLYYVNQEWNGLRFNVQSVWPTMKSLWSPEQKWLTIDFGTGLYLEDPNNGNNGPVLKLMPGGLGGHNNYELAKWMQNGGVSSFDQFWGGDKGCGAWIACQNWHGTGPANSGLFVCRPDFYQGQYPTMNCTVMFGDGSDYGAALGNGAVMAHGELGNIVPVTLTGRSYTAVKANYSNGTNGVVTFRTESGGQFHPPNIVIGTQTGATGEVRNDSIGLLLTFQSGLLVSGTGGTGGGTIDGGTW